MASCLHPTACIGLRLEQFELLRVGEWQRASAAEVLVREEPSVLTDVEPSRQPNLPLGERALNLVQGPDAVGDREVLEDDDDLAVRLCLWQNGVERERANDQRLERAEAAAAHPASGGGGRRRQRRRRRGARLAAAAATAAADAGASAQLLGRRLHARRVKLPKQRAARVHEQ